MPTITAATDVRMIAFMVPSIPESVAVARFHIQASLRFHRLDEYSDEAGIVTSELVTNAVQHVCDDRTKTIGVILARVREPDAVVITVTDDSPEGPVMREAADGSESGRGLQIIEALSVHWGWHPENDGKAIFAILAKDDA